MEERLLAFWVGSQQNLPCPTKESGLYPIGMENHRKIFKAGSSIIIFHHCHQNGGVLRTGMGLEGGPRVRRLHQKILERILET